MRDMDCIGCGVALDPLERQPKHCYECDINHYWSYGYRRVGQYQIRWWRDERKSTTIVRAPELWEPVWRSAGWRLFDIKTPEQLERLLILI